jgi:hypothetical protein
MEKRRRFPFSLLTTMGLILLMGCSIGPKEIRSEEGGKNRPPRRSGPQRQKNDRPIS